MAEQEIILPGEGAGLGGFTERELDEIERRLDRVATALDSAFRVPVLGIRFGADSLVGLIPGVGDVIGLGLSSYLLIEARRLGAPAPLLARMAANIGIDAAVGSVPLLGDAFDLVFKANRRNMALLRGHLRDLRAGSMKDVTRR